MNLSESYKKRLKAIAGISLNENINTNVLNQIENYIQQLSYRGDTETDTEYGSISYSDRVSPAIKSGPAYDSLWDRVKGMVANLKNSQWKDMINVEYTYNDEWVGFNVRLLK